MKQLKEDNRGLSLIEVMVAVMILAIVVTPFLHSFVTAATTNSKAKKIHKATIVAQSVMEGIKAQSLEDLAMQFNHPEEGFYVLPSDRIELKTGEEWMVGELTDRSVDGNYFYFLKGVKEDTSTYDVLVELDATAYRTGGAVEEAHQYNSDELTQLPVIDLDRDAMSIQKETYTEAAVENFLTTGAEETVIREKMSRTITVTVDRSHVGTEYRTTVTTEYRYIFEHDGEMYYYDKKQTAFDSTETGEELRAVYLYYYPLYSAGVPRDEIKFVNNGKVPVNFYLLKQKSSTAAADDEEQYRMKLTLIEADATEDAMLTKLHTNLATNLSSGNKIVALTHIVTLNGSAIDDLTKIISDNILFTEDADRMFDVEVSVYEPGAGDEGYPEDERLTTLEGSKTN